jgi:hypothetical protein
MKKSRTINIAVTVRKFTREERKRYRAYTQADERGEENIRIFIDEKEAKGRNFVENIFHEFTHAYVRMGSKRNISVDDEERLAQIVGKTVDGLMRGFTLADWSAKWNRKYYNKPLVSGLKQ